MKKRCFFRQSKTLAWLAAPQVFVCGVGVAAGIIDTIMVSEAGIDDVSGVSVGAAYFALAATFIGGIMSSIHKLVAEKRGAKESPEEIAMVGAHGVIFAVMVGVVLGIILLILSQPLSNLHANFGFGVKAQNVFVGYMLIVACAVPAVAVLRALMAYINGLDRVSFVIPLIMFMVIMGLNVPMNYMLINGEFGMPKLGGVGAGVGTVVTYYFTAIILFVYTKKSRMLQEFCFRWSKMKLQCDLLKRFWRDGWANASGIVAESFFFRAMVLMSVGLGKASTVSQQIIFNFTNITYCFYYEIGIVALGELAKAVGANDDEKARIVVLASTCLAMCFSVVAVASVLFLFDEWLDWHNATAEVRNIVIDLLLCVCFLQIFDTKQFLYNSLVMAYGKSMVLLVAKVIVFALALVLGSIYAYNGVGVAAFWYGLTCALAVVAVFSFRIVQKQLRAN